MILTPDNFENQISALVNLCDPKKLSSPEPIDHIVMNCTRDCAPAIEQIQDRIAKAQPNQMLYKLDLRVIFHAQGNPENWSLEAVGPTRSLATVGQRPTS